MEVVKQTQAARIVLGLAAEAEMEVVGVTGRSTRGEQYHGVPVLPACEQPGRQEGGQVGSIPALPDNAAVLITELDDPDGAAGVASEWIWRLS